MPINGRLSNVINAADLQREINEIKEDKTIYLHCLTMTEGQINIYNSSAEQISTVDLAKILIAGGFVSPNKLFKHEGTQFIPEHTIEVEEDEETITETIPATIRTVCGTYAESEIVLKVVYCETTTDSILCSTGAQVVIYEDIIKM